jgi:predicted ArsR family transcriptional regulator
MDDIVPVTQQGETLNLPHRGPAGEILRLLQRNGPMSIKQLRDELGVRSLNAVREQLMSLTAEGLIQARPVRQGAGRPAFVYTLSAKAQQLFPKGYDVLLKLLLEELVAQEGRERVQALLAKVSARLAQQYGDGAGQSLMERLAVLAEVSAARGTPIAIVEQGDEVLLNEYSCPYFNVAQDNQDVCAVEQRMLEQVLGRKVRLTRRMTDGHPGCQFAVEQREAAHETTQESPDEAA